MLATLGASDGSMPDTAALQIRISELWRAYLEPQSVAAGVPGHIIGFLAKRMLSNDPNALVLMARHMLTAPDRTAELVRLDQMPMLVIYGENDNSWSPVAQEHAPGQAPPSALSLSATTAIALTQFWDAAESTAMHAAVTGTA